jgi:hypothetical protein
MIRGITTLEAVLTFQYPWITGTTDCYYGLAKPWKRTTGARPHFMWLYAALSCVSVARNGTVVMGLAFLLVTYGIVLHNIGNAASRLIIPTPPLLRKTNWYWHTHTPRKNSNYYKYIYIYIYTRVFNKYTY